jgi:hypothetical protein
LWGGRWVGEGESEGEGEGGGSWFGGRSWARGSQGLAGTFLVRTFRFGLNAWRGIGIPNWLLWDWDRRG